MDVQSHHGIVDASGVVIRCRATLETVPAHRDFRERVSSVNPSTLYVQPLLDGGIMVIREDNERPSALVSREGLKAELAKLKASGGVIQYSGEDTSGDVPNYIRDTFKLIESFGIPIRFVEPLMPVNARPENYVPALLQSAFRGQLSWLNELVSGGVDLEVSDRYGQTALMVAAEAGQLESVRILLGAGAKVNAKDMDGSTPLMFACQSGHYEVAKLLLDAGADVHATGTHGLDAIKIATRYNHGDVVTLLQSATS